MAKFYTPIKLSENIRETPEGYLWCLAVQIARTGWMEYGEGETPLEVGDDGTIQIYRSPEEVFRPQTIASFQGKPITIRHPNDFVGPANWQALSRGILQNVRKADGEDDDGEESLLADLLITETTAIGLVKNGLREVSCGYEAEYEQTGEGKGRQYNIVGNHLALVEEGRAGSSYKINDHKGKGTMSGKLIERLKAKFGAKVVDAALVEDDDASEMREQLEGIQATLAALTKDAKGKKSKTVDGYEGLDELKQMVSDLSKKMDEMGKADDEEEPAPKKKKDEPKDEEEEKSEDEEEGDLGSRLKAVEAAVAKILEKMSGESGDEEEESSEESSDEGEEEEESEDEEKSDMTGDAARAEILAPGMKAKKGESESTFRSRALVAAFGTADGRKVIEGITGKKKLTLDSSEKINALFIAASAMLADERGTGLEGTKRPLRHKAEDSSEGGEMTPEKMNQINAKHYGKKEGA